MCIQIGCKCFPCLYVYNSQQNNVKLYQLYKTGLKLVLIELNKFGWTTTKETEQKETVIVVLPG